MRIAWFTPASGESGVVDYSRHVLAELQTVADPVLFCQGPPEGFADVESVDLTESPAPSSLATFDAIFYNLGNNLRYHSRIWDWARAHPGILILHDRVLHHFFVEYYQRRLRSPDTYLGRMSALYGAASSETATRMLDRRRWSEVSGEQLLRYSFLEEALTAARGVVVHSHWHEAAVRRSWSGPVSALWLPSYGPPPPERTLTREDRRVTLLTLGHVEFNKHSDMVVRSLGTDPELARRVRYLIAGSYRPDSPYVRHLAEEISGYSLAGTVNLLGFLSENGLAKHAAEADVFVNLRWPNYEGSSASLMYELGLGKPVVVYRAGSFAELPDDSVIKLDPSDESQLQRRLSELARSPQLRARIGTAGRRFAASRSPHAYAERLVAFAADVGAWTPGVGIAERIGRELAVLDVDPRLDGIEHVREEMLSLFGSGASRHEAQTVHRPVLHRSPRSSRDTGGHRPR